MKVLPCLLLLLLPPPAPLGAAPAPLTVRVWPGLAPGETTADPGHVTPGGGAVKTVTDVTGPQLFVYRPDGRPGHPAVLVLPGGGYQVLAVDLEGAEVARWLNAQGCVAAVLHYRVPGRRGGAYQDAQRALSLVRARAADFGADAGRVGVMGFSAGGHLAARLAAGGGARTYAAVDGADARSCRPDFALLIYPAYLADGAAGAVAPEVRPQAGMPPVFASQTRADPYFCVLPYAAALARAGAPSEALIYDGGGHGYGLRAPADQPVSHWPDEAAAWLRARAGARAGARG